MSFRIAGLDPALFRPLYGLGDAELAAHGVRRCVAQARPGLPDRVEVRDAEPGESLLLLNYTHQPADTAYRASHAIFVLEGAERAYDRVDEVPEALRIRTISLRGFDCRHEMVEADLVEGRGLEGVIERFFADREVAYIHAHYARRGCYAARIERA